MTEAMPFLQKYDITFLRPPPIRRVLIRILCEPPKNAGYKADSFGCPPFAMP